MGFLKKKPSVRMPGELGTSSSKPSPGGGMMADRNNDVDVLQDECRDDATDVQSRATAGSRTSKASSKSKSKSKLQTAEAREQRIAKKEAAKRMDYNKIAEAARREILADSKSSKTSSSSAAAGGQSSSVKPKKKASTSGAKAQRGTETGSGAAAGARKSASRGREAPRASQPPKLGGVKKPSSSSAAATEKKVRGSSLEKKNSRSRARHTLSPIQRGGKSTPAAKAKTQKAAESKRKSKATESSKIEGVASAKSAKEHKRPAVKEREGKAARPQTQVRGEKVGGRTEKGASSSVRRRLPSPQGGRRKGEAASGRGRRDRDRPPASNANSRRFTFRKRRDHRSLEESSIDDGSSCSSGGSFTEEDDDESLTSYNSDTELEDSTFCTEGSGFVSVGCSNDESRSMSFTDDDEGYTESEGETDGGGRTTYEETDDEDEDSDSKVGARSAAARSGAASTKDARSDAAVNDDSVAAKKGDGDRDEVGGLSGKDDKPSAAAPPPLEGEEEAAARTDLIKRSTSSKSSSGRGGEIASKKSTMRDFMKKMEEFTVMEEEHQLLVQVVEHGNVEKLQLQELTHVPKPNNPNEIVIKVDASTITLQDCMIRRGKWYEMQSLPFVPGSDVVGIIHEVGDAALANSTFRVGDKVAAVIPSGGNAKYITVPYTQIIRVPAQTDSDVALCLSSAYVPAKEALDLARKLNTPFTSANILVIGGNGPSGLATIELALLEGANVFATADERHHQFLTNLGAKCFPIDPDRWLPTLRGKMDVVLDSVCLDGYESSSAALNTAGKLVCTGMSAVYTQGQIRAFGMKDVRDYKAMYYKMRAKYMLTNAVYYDRMERYELAPNEYAQHFRYLCHLTAKDSIKPLISQRSPLNLVASMQRAIEHGDTSYGVCVCTPWTKTSEM